MFLFANFMYVFTVLAFNIGAPWRKPFFTNYLFMIPLTIILTYSILMCAVPATRSADFQITFMDDMKVNGFVLGMGLAFGFTIFILQKFVW